MDWIVKNISGRERSTLLIFCKAAGYIVWENAEWEGETFPHILKASSHASGKTHTFGCQDSMRTTLDMYKPKEITLEEAISMLKEEIENDKYIQNLGL